jgi:5-oxoprolinase (ATP-hydrolysing) subunit A
MMAPPRRVDLNADVGEGRDDEALMPYLTSVSVACGAHAGDNDTMTRTLTAARHHGLRAGAHPGYPDRAGFGRVTIDISLDELETSLQKQLARLQTIGRRVGVALTHVKAHGALYNRAWRDRATADVIARATAGFDPAAVLFCPAGSAQEDAARAEGLGVVREVFLDRRYGGDGTLLPRGHPGAMVAAATDLGAQVSFLEGLQFETMCVHGDNPAALELLGAVPALFADRGWRVAPYPVTV